MVNSLDAVDDSVRERKDSGFERDETLTLHRTRDYEKRRTDRLPVRSVNIVVRVEKSFITHSHKHTHKRMMRLCVRLNFPKLHRDVDADSPFNNYAHPTNGHDENANETTRDDDLLLFKICRSRRTCGQTFVSLCETSASERSRKCTCATAVPSVRSPESVCLKKYR